MATAVTITMSLKNTRLGYVLVKISQNVPRILNLKLAITDEGNQRSNIKGMYIVFLIVASTRQN